MHCQVTRDCDSQDIEIIDSVESQYWKRKAEEDFFSVAKYHFGGLTAVWTLVINNRPRLNVVEFILYELTVARRDQKIGVISIFVHFISKSDSFEIMALMT